MYVGQKLQFKRTPIIQTHTARETLIPNQFYEAGCLHLRGFEKPEHVKEYLDRFVAAIDPIRHPAYELFRDRIQLAKVVRAPFTDQADIPFVALHFEMGAPLIAIDDQTTVCSLMGLYFPHDSEPNEVRTRTLHLGGLLSSHRWPDEREVEDALKFYAENYGDGWGDYSTGRLSCVARLLDGAVSDNELSFMKSFKETDCFNRSADGEWVDGYQEEIDYFLSHGFLIETWEKRYTLRPGDLLIIDNLRVAHGQIGQREPEEIYQFIYGTNRATAFDVDQLRRQLVSTLKTLS